MLIRNIQAKTLLKQTEYVSLSTKCSHPKSLQSPYCDRNKKEKMKETRNFHQN